MEEKLAEIVQSMIAMREPELHMTVITCQLENVFGDDWIVHVIR